MSLSYVQYVADGNTAEFDVPFPFENRTHVKIRIDGNPPVLPIRWVGDSRIRIADSIANGSIVELRRETPISSRLVDFQNGSVLTEEELDTALNQVFYLQQELKDLYEDTLEGRLAAIANGGGYVIPEGADIVSELANYVVATQAAQDLANSVQDIANQGNALAQQALEILDLDDALQINSANLTAAQTNLQSAINTVDGRVDMARTDIDNLITTVDALAGGDPGTGIATLIQAETTARIAGDQAIVDDIALIGAVSGDGLSFILDTSKVRVSPSETLAERFSAIVATDNSNTAAITSEQTARINADTALASDISVLDTRMGDAEASVVSEQTARINGDNALTTNLNALTVRVNTAEADIVSEQTARANADGALTTSLNALTARVDDAEADIISEQTARASGDSALTTSLNALSARVDDAEADILSEQTARASGDSALTTSLNALTARVTTAEGDIADNAAGILSEATARANAISAEASARTLLAARVTTTEGDITALEGSVSTNAAAIQSEATARANAISAEASARTLLAARVTTAESDITSLEGSVSTNASAIASEQTTRANADSALASDITALTTTVNGNTSTVTTLAASVNGIAARYGVSLDVNGYVTGFVQNNDGSQGDFIIMADRFAIVDPNGGPGQTPVIPFEVNNGDVKINGNLVVAGTITSSQLALNSVTKGNSAYTQGNIGIPSGDVWTTVQSCSLTTSGGEVKIDFCGCYDRFGGGSTNVVYRIRRGSTTIREGTLVQVYGEQVVNIQSSETFQTIGTANIPYPTSGTYSIVAVDTTAPAGAHTYTVELASLQTGGIMNSRQMALLELKR